MIIFTDLDDTLMKTKRKVNLNENLTEAAFSNKGEIISYANEKEIKMIENLINKNDTIPVTARSEESFNNLNNKLFNFKKQIILNFGFSVFSEKNIKDEYWKNKMHDLSMKLNQNNLFNKIKVWFKEGSFINMFELKERYVDTFGIFLNFRNKALNKFEIQAFKVELKHILILNGLQDDFYFYETDRDITLLPYFIKKENAVQYVKEKYYSSNDLFIGIGDNLNDINFMRICDFCISPSESSIIKNLSKI